MQDGYSDGIEVVLGYSPYTKKRPASSTKSSGSKPFTPRYNTFPMPSPAFPIWASAETSPIKKPSSSAIKASPPSTTSPAATTTSSSTKWPQKEYRHRHRPRHLHVLRTQKILRGMVSPKIPALHDRKILQAAGTKSSSAYIRTTYFLFYPLLIVSLFFDWRMALAIFGVRLIVQGNIFQRPCTASAKKTSSPGGGCSISGCSHIT